VSGQNSIVSNFAICLSEANGFEECFKLLIHSVQQLGFDGVLYMSTPLGLVSNRERQPLFIFQASDAYTPVFLEHYTQANFFENDYTVKATSTGNMELIDWWGKTRENALTKNEQKVFTVAREEYKMRNGLSIPTLCTPYEIAGASVTSADSDQTFSQLLSDNAKYIKTIIRLFHYRVQADLECKKVFISPLLEDLSIKERQLLKFIVTALPLKMIDIHYDISPGYAKNMISSVCEKLAVKNIHELRYFLGIHRIIEFL